MKQKDDFARAKIWVRIITSDKASAELTKTSIEKLVPGSRGVVQQNQDVSHVLIRGDARLNDIIPLLKATFHSKGEITPPTEMQLTSAG